MKKAEPRQRIQLRCKGDLDRYLFTDQAHAIRWLGQRYIQTSLPSMKISLVMAVETKCGDDRVTKVLRTMKAADFLTEFKLL